MASDKLTERDYSTLARAVTLRERFDAGIFPIGSGGHAHFRRLERLGFIAFEGWGRDIDGEVERDVLSYQLTERGRAAAWRREAGAVRGQTANMDGVPEEELIAAALAAQESVTWDVDGLLNQVDEIRALVGRSIGLMDVIAAGLDVPQPAMPYDAATWAGWLAFHIQETP